MMTESVQPTGRPIESLSIEIASEQPKSSLDSFWDRYCPERMETKTKIYICILLILPSLIYFLVAVNSSHPKRAGFEKFDSPLTLNITTFSEDGFTTEEYADAFDLAVKNDQLVMPTGFSSETLKKYVATSSSSMRRDDESTIYLLHNS